MITLHEQFNNFKGRGKNAPEFIYSVLYDTDNPPRMRGRGASHPEKNVNGIPVDKAIPNKAIKELAKINEIELRASCQGSGPERPTFLIFRFEDNPGRSYIEKFCQRLYEDGKYYCGFELGNSGYYRIGITNKIWYSRENKKEFEDWWLNLPQKIKKALR